MSCGYLCVQHGQKNNNVLKAAIYATEQAAHKPVLKQLSLPTKFAFHLDPPTPVLSSCNIATDDEHCKLDTASYIICKKLYSL